MERVYALQDDSGHWYVIPHEFKRQFFELLNLTWENDECNYEAAKEFEEKFGKYRTEGDINNIKLYAEI